MNSREAELRAACRRVEQLAQSGNGLAVEFALDEFPQFAHDQESLVELVYTEIVAREDLGREVRAGDYAQRFPSISHRLKRVLDVHGALGQVGNSTISAPDLTLPANSRDPSVRRLGGYELLEEIGCGGHGVVYKARQRGLDRIVAVKVLRPFESDVQLARFRHEAETAARLQHPNIVHVYEVGEDQGCQFLSMELVDGGSLEQQLAYELLDIRRSVQWMDAIARGVDFAHQRGIVHRDLKPANVLIDEQAAPKITDFGLARLTGVDGLARTKTGDFLGTPYYMAPEQHLAPSDVGPEADVFSLGVIFYEMLTGRKPFPGESIAEVFRQAHDGEPASPRRLRPEIPVDLEVICLKCLRREPESRYPVAGDLALELRRFMDGLPIRARPISAWNRLAKWAVRRPMIAALTTALAGAVLLGSLGSVWGWRATARALDSVRHERDVSARALYFQTVGRAARDLRSGDSMLARGLLDQCEPVLRGWEWRYLDRLQRASHRAHRGHVSESVRRARFSPDGRWLLTTSWDWNSSRPGDSILREAGSGDAIATFQDHPGAVHDAAFGPNGERFATAGAGGVVVRSCESHAILQRLATDRTVLCVAFAPDGRRLAEAGGDGVVRIWDIEEGRVVLASTPQPKGSRIYSVAYDPAGQRIAASCTLGRVFVYETTNMRRTHQLTTRENCRCVEFSRDGQLLGATSDGLTVWKRNGDAFETLLETNGRGFTSTASFAFAPDSQCAALLSGNQVELVDARRGVTLKTTTAHSRYAIACGFSNDCRTLATVGGDGHVRLWDRAPNQFVISRPENAHARSLAFHPSGRWLAIGGGFNRVTWGAGSKSVLLVDAQTRDVARTFVSEGWTNQVVFSGRGDLLAAACDDGLRVWRFSDGELMHAQVQAAPVVAVALIDRQDGVDVVAIGRDGVSMTPVGKNKPRWTSSLAKLTAVAAHPAAPWIVVGNELGILTILDSDTGRILESRATSDGEITAISFSPRGDLLASAGTEERARIWSVDNTRPPKLKLKHTLRGHSAPVSDVAFGADGLRVVTAGRDNSTRIWDVASGREALALHREGQYNREVYCARFSPDGNRLATSMARYTLVYEAGANDNVDADNLRRASGLAWRRRQASACESIGNWRGASLHWREALSLAPDDKAIRLRLGECCFRDGDWDGARRHLSGAAQPAAEPLVLLRLPGSAQRPPVDWTARVTAARLAVATAPRDDEAWTRLATTLAIAARKASGDSAGPLLADAIACRQVLLNRLPQEPQRMSALGQALANLADARDRSGDSRRAAELHQEATEAYRRAVGLAPGDDAIRRGCTLRLKDHAAFMISISLPNQAEALVREAISMWESGGSRRSHLDLAKLHWTLTQARYAQTPQRGDWRAALEQAERALDQLPKLSTGSTSNSLLTMRRSLQATLQRETRHRVFAWGGRAYAESGDRQQALRRLDAGVEREEGCGNRRRYGPPTCHGRVGPRRGLETSPVDCSIMCRT